MEKHIADEKMGIGYTLQGDYYIPDLTLPPETDNRPIGIWGRQHRDYLKNHRKAVYSIMLMDNTLHSYLADIDEQAGELFFRLVKDICHWELTMLKELFLKRAGRWSAQDIIHSQLHLTEKKYS